MTALKVTGVIVVGLGMGFVGWWFFYPLLDEWRRKRRGE